METITIIKIGGKELDTPTFLGKLCPALAALDRPVVLVHGGGKEISAAMDRFGQTVHFIEGLRVTPPESMAVMEMVVCGSINKRLVAALTMAGRRAIGLSGVDLGLLRCVPHRPGGTDLGRVGTITAVDHETLHTLLRLGWLPVLAPVALGQEDGLSYNVNADHVALAIAESLSRNDDGKLGTRTSRTELVFVSNVPGVLSAGQVIPHLAAAEIESHIQAGIITEGMIPKVRSALAARAAGVATVRITNLEGLEDGGTRIS
ncbi:MAG: acetylglutamate kinase [Chloroflexaceae bacterium]|nr:acetylglutamate kinase [Chloroflexaceae bacterium]